MRQRFGIAQALLGDPQLLIVDEPTAGLDPMERNRFYDLLAGIGENIVVILSTHIVEDVHDLCADMAVMAHGKIILRGSPSSLTKELDGRVWRKTIARETLGIFQQTMEVITTRMKGGRLQVHVLSEFSPGAGFEPFDPALEDVYFTALTGTKKFRKGGDMLSNLLRFEWRYHSRQLYLHHVIDLFFGLGFPGVQRQFRRNRSEPECTLRDQLYCMPAFAHVYFCIHYFLRQCSITLMNNMEWKHWCSAAASKDGSGLLFGYAGWLWLHFLYLRWPCRDAGWDGAWPIPVNWEASRSCIMPGHCCYSDYRIFSFAAVLYSVQL